MLKYFQRRPASLRNLKSKAKTLPKTLMMKMKRRVKIEKMTLTKRSKSNQSSIHCLDHKTVQSVLTWRR